MDLISLFTNTDFKSNLNAPYDNDIHRLREADLFAASRIKLVLEISVPVASTITNALEYLKQDTPRTW
jgi:hypothetical protein